MLFHSRNRGQNQAEIAERLLPEDSVSDYSRSSYSTKINFGRCSLLITLLNLVVLSTSIIVIQSGWYRDSLHSTRLNEVLRRTSTSSPIYDHVEFQLSLTVMNGSVLKAQDTPWNSGPEVEEKEALWNDLEHIRAIPLTSDQVLKMGKDPTKCAKLEDSFFHMGEDLYMGGLDIFHQAHCLNRLRKAALGGTSYTGSAREHTLHCIDMLMQHLLCTADTGFYTYNWYEGIEWPQPDFSVQRKCKDWQQIVRYRDAYAVAPKIFEAFKKPEGVYENKVGEI